MTPQRCSQCNEALPGGVRFCGQCGTSAEVTRVDARTLLSKTFAATTLIPKAAIKTAIQRAETAFGVGRKGDPTRILGSDARTGQRELVVLVNDVSPSMEEDYDGTMIKLDASIRASVNLILNKHHIDPDDQIALVTFHEKATLDMPLTPTRHGKCEMIRRVQSLRTRGAGTSLQAGLECAEKALDWSSSNVVRRIIMLTDGHSGNPAKIAADLKSQGVVIDVIGVGKSPRKVNEKVLRQIASTVEGELRYRFIRDQATLVAHYTGLAMKTATAIR